MLVIHVDVRVRPEDVEAFLIETRRNASLSVAEPGVRRFDVLLDEGDTTHVVLSEAYVDQEAADAHKQTDALRALARRRRRDDGAAAQLDAVHRGVPRGGRLVSVRPGAAAEGDVRARPRGRARGACCRPSGGGSCCARAATRRGTAHLLGRRRAGRVVHGHPRADGGRRPRRDRAGAGRGCGRRRRHRRGQRARPGQGGRGAARQRHRSAGPPRGRRPGRADRAAVGAVRRRAHHRGHRRRGDRQRAAALPGARASRPASAARTCCRRSRWSTRCSPWAARPR